MNILYILVMLYPVYRTSECIRNWNKVKKIHFQNLCVLWYTFFFLTVFRDAFSWLMSYFYVLSIYDLVVLVCIISNYTPRTSYYFRSFVVLPLIREVRKWSYPIFLEMWCGFSGIFGEENILRIWSQKIFSNENIFT